MNEGPSNPFGKAKPVAPRASPNRPGSAPSPRPARQPGLEQAEIDRLVRWIVKSWAAIGFGMAAMYVLGSAYADLGRIEDGEKAQFLVAILVFALFMPLWALVPLLPLAIHVAVVGLPTFLLASLALARSGTDVRRIAAGCAAAAAVWATHRFIDLQALIASVLER